ncbi:MAG: acyl-CoA synthetase [Ottowia sp.]|nr:acyl-CoA synthetase [Ottowia sp.]
MTAGIQALRPRHAARQQKGGKLMNPVIHGNSLGDTLARTAWRVPDKTALVWQDKTLTYAAFDDVVNRCANAIAAHGIVKGDRVAMFSHNHLDFVLVYYALTRLGAISVPINYMLSAGDVAYILAHSGAVGLVAEDTLVGTAEAALQQATPAPTLQLRGVIRTGDCALPAGWEATADWQQHADATPPDVEIADEDCLQLLYTSGTESRPKGTMQCSRNLIAQYVSCIVDGDMQAGDIEVHALPLYHSAQTHCFLGPDVMLGATSVILPGADPVLLLQAVQEHRATKLFCPPTVWIALLRHPEFDRHDLSSLQKGYYGASIMPRPIIEELSSRLPAMRLYNFYGQTEMGPVATVLQPQDQLRKLGSAGLPCINVQTRVVDDADQPVAAGVVGEIVHRSPHVMLGYWNDAEKTAEAFRNGWFHSGDLAYADEDGYLYIVDRKKDIIITGGENVSGREVEEAMYGHPAVGEVAAIGVPHPKWVEAVTIVVVAKAGHQVTEEELLDYGRKHLTAFKAPKYVILVDDLPRNASGKLLKRNLRQQYAGLAEQQPG